MSTRDEQAMDIVKRHALYAGAVGLVPVPLADLAAITAIEIRMVRELAAHYGVPFSEDRLRPAIASFLGAYIATTVGFGGGGALARAVPLIGSALGVLAVPGFAAGFTWAVGKVFILQFASGGALLDFDPARFQTRIVEHAKSA